MKKLIWIAGIAALVSASSVFAEEVNFRAANPVLQALVDAVTAGDELVDFAYPRFDESVCDLKAERIKYDFQGSLKNTPWLEGGKADITGTSTYSADRTAGHTGISAHLTGTVRTDVLALIRYSAYIAIRKFHNLGPKFDARYEAHLKRLAVATSLEQVQVLLVSGQQLAKDVIADEVQKRVDTLHCLESGACLLPGENQQQSIEYQKAWIEVWRKTLPAYDRINIAAKAESGKVRELTVSSPEMGLFMLDTEKDQHDFLIIPGNGSITFADTVVSSDAEAFHKIPLADLNRMKADFVTRLIGVQNGNGEHKDIVQSKFREALIDFKKAIRGEW